MMLQRYKIYHEQTNIFDAFFKITKKYKVGRVNK